VLNQIVAHYRVIEKLGGGGMGIVYRAEDLKLKREVALKFLPKNVSRDRSAIERFEREAEAAAAINHPNICTVYDIGEFEGSPYLAMEFLQGETLKYRITGKPVPLSTLLDWSIQITDGLAAAHARGIIHRDLNACEPVHHGRRAGKDSRFRLGEVAIATEIRACGSVGQDDCGVAD
jgi:serine/threonine protein kinase